MKLFNKNNTGFLVEGSGNKQKRKSVRGMKKLFRRSSLNNNIHVQEIS